MAQAPKQQSGKPKVALVTGSNKGIGLACVDHLFRTLPDGSTIYLTSRDLDRAKSAKDEILKKYNIANRNSEIRPFKFDISLDDDINSLTNDIKKNNKGIDIIISNAGAPIAHFSDKKQYTIKSIEMFLNVANFGNYKLMKSLFPLLNPFARVVIIASAMGTLHVMPKQSKKLAHYMVSDETTMENLVDITQIYLNDLRALPEFGGKNLDNKKYSVTLNDNLKFSEKYPMWANEMSKILQVKFAKILCRNAHNESLTENGRNGIIVNACCPGWVKTDLTREIVENNPQWEKMCRPASEAAMHVCNLALLPKVLYCENEYPTVLDIKYKHGTNFQENSIQVPFGQLVQYGKIIDYYCEFAQSGDNKDNIDNDDTKSKD